MFFRCNNLSQDSLNHIYELCINAINVTNKNLNKSNIYSPLYNTKFTSSNIPADYKTRLTAAG